MLKNKQAKYLIIWVFIFTSDMAASQMLTYQDAIALALKNNYNLKAAQWNAQMATTNNTWGNTGLLPTISLNASGSFSAYNEQQTTADGIKTEESSVVSQKIAAGPELSWNFFESGRMCITKQKLDELEILGGIILREQVLQTLHDVTQAYYLVVKQKQLAASLTETVNFSNERVKISEAAFKIGNKPKTDWLQAKIDANLATQNLITQQTSIDEAKRELNLVLGIDQNISFDVTDSVPLPEKEWDEFYWLSKMDSSNTTLKYYRKQNELAVLTIKEIKRRGLPSLGISAGYDYLLTKKNIGAIRSQQNFGPNLGVQLNIPLYQGGNLNRQVQLAEIEQKNANDQLSFIELSVKMAFNQAFNQFIRDKRLWLLEKENHEWARENLLINLEQLRLGNSTSLQVHQAQEDFVQSATRLVQYSYNLKMAETRLKQLANEW